MQLPPIQYHIQRGQIATSQTDAQVQINQREADLQISQPEADLQITHTPSKLTIDQTAAWRDMGIISIEESISKSASEGMQKAIEGMARRARDGNEMQRIENGGDAIPRIAKRNMPNERQDFTIGFIPSSYFAVDIDYDPGDVEVNIQKNDPIIDARAHKPTFDYTPGQLDTYLAQEPHFEIDVDMDTFRAQQLDMKI
ncbi:DUF6470 family protein [Alkalibacillus haloalkaliphilus]|uniref:Uncharacterized protein n=1 Tax=Alkalibacillus haloalkaliphilus TaxID=94136 RepID=A0A511W7V5_9BACI|nr:DUF6470 family protein [Alkalibacillus haloalkaliphilus]GEN47164.1 hypothetical protein AHA02nite_29400 [Alkalibacillus haloalkaliphilus]